MRTRALLCAAALAAGIATSMAQSNVYSLNVVGYYNVPVVANQLMMVANQLNTTNNTIGSLLPSGPPGAQLYKFNGGYTIYTFDDVDLVWYPDAKGTLNPGEGAFFRSPVATTITFVGEVLQGSLTNTLPINQYAIRSSMVPQAATLSQLGLAGEPGDQLYQYANGYTIFTFDDVDLVWYPHEPSLGVGEAFFYHKSPIATQSNWVRNFTVQ